MWIFAANRPQKSRFSALFGACKVEFRKKNHGGRGAGKGGKRRLYAGMPQKRIPVFFCFFLPPPLDKKVTFS
jgi:hypothetical protein